MNNGTWKYAPMRVPGSWFINIVLAPSRLQFLHFRCISKQVLKEKKKLQLLFSLLADDPEIAFVSLFWHVRFRFSIRPLKNCKRFYFRKREESFPPPLNVSRSLRLMVWHTPRWLYSVSHYGSWTWVNGYVRRVFFLKIFLFVFFVRDFFFFYKRIRCFWRVDAARHATCRPIGMLNLNKP